MLLLETPEEPAASRAFGAFRAGVKNVKRRTRKSLTRTHVLFVIALLAGGNRHLQTILRRRQGTGRVRRISAGRIFRTIEVEP